MDALRAQRERGEVFLAIVFALMAGVGGWLHASLLTLFGSLGALSAAVLYVWQRECLVRLSYRRNIGVTRAEFGERLSLEIELVNDKLLPLPWVQVTDLVPVDLTIEEFEGVVRKRESRWFESYEYPDQVDDAPPPGTRKLTQLFAMLPFQRTTRQINLVCDRRGRHRFGTSTVSSGDPLGIIERSEVIGESSELIVYPKIFALTAPPIASRTPMGDDRSMNRLIGDPHRVAGMRAYRPGDPLRHIDWRATARSGDLLVRDFEPTTTLRVAVFVDADPTPITEETGTATIGEFAIAVGASLLTWGAEQGYPVGLFAPGTADGEIIAHGASSAPGTIATLLELLALCEGDPTRSLATVLVTEAERLARGTTVIVVAPDFNDEVMIGIAECRRRSPVTAIYVANEGGRPPAPSSVDASYVVGFEPDWQVQDSVLFAG